MLGRAARMGPQLRPTLSPPVSRSHLLSDHLVTLPQARHEVRDPRGLCPDPSSPDVGRPSQCWGAPSFLPSPYGHISCPQLGCLPRPRPINNPEEPSWVGAREEASPAACLCSPGPRPSPAEPQFPPRPAGTRRRGLECSPSEGVTSSGGGSRSRGFCLRTLCDLALVATQTLQSQTPPPPLPAATRIPRRPRP